VTIDDRRLTEEAHLIRRKRAAGRRAITAGPHSHHVVLLAGAAHFRRTGWNEACVRYLNMAKRIRLGAPRLP
jgi:hypothetical protein